MTAGFPTNSADNAIQSNNASNPGRMHRPGLQPTGAGGLGGGGQ